VPISATLAPARRSGRPPAHGRGRLWGSARADVRGDRQVASGCRPCVL